MQHSKHLKITVAVVGLVVVAIIVAVVLAVQTDPKDVSCSARSALTDISVTNAICRPFNQDVCGTSKYCEWNSTTLCSAKSEFGDKSVDAAICKPLSDIASCDQNPDCEWTCATFAQDKCGDAGLIAGFEKKTCQASGCSVDTCCEAPANPGAAVAQN
jgi:hypothetical protein